MYIHKLSFEVLKERKDKDTDTQMNVFLSVRRLTMLVGEKLDDLRDNDTTINFTIILHLLFVLSNRRK